MRPAGWPSKLRGSGIQLHEHAILTKSACELPTDEPILANFFSGNDKYDL